MTNQIGTLYLVFIHFIVLCIHLLLFINPFQGVMHPSQQTKDLVEAAVLKPLVPILFYNNCFNPLK